MEATAMETTATPRQSFVELLRSLKDDTRQLLRQEVELAKAEMSEKLKLFARNAGVLAVGGLVAYGGVIVFLMSLGWLVAWALQRAGLQPVLAGFLGLAIIGVLVAAVGAAVLLKGLKTFSQESLAPQRTIHTIQRLKGAKEQTSPGLQPNDPPKRSSEEIQAWVEETENRMSNTLDELGYRLSPKHINAQVKHRIQERPYRSGLLAMTAGLVSGLFLTRASRRS
jgi:ElaB/YqjD/DUF883 family membrane-anchored ribosome-binding protein